MVCVVTATVREARIRLMAGKKKGWAGAGMMMWLNYNVGKTCILEWIR
jgi:hypothetical protein